VVTTFLLIFVLLVVYLTTLSVAQIIVHRMIGGLRLMNLEGHGGDCGLPAGIFTEGLEKSKKMITTAHLCAEIFNPKLSEYKGVLTRRP
jgi:hypothetical protein